MAPSPTGAYGALDEAIAAQRCIVLDGGVATELPGGGGSDDERLWGMGALLDAPDAVLDLHRRYVAAGCDVLSTDTWGLPTALRSDSPPVWARTGEPVHWMDLARRGIRLARTAAAEAPGDRPVAVALSLNGDIDAPEGPESVHLLARAVAADPPDLILLETLSLVRPSLLEVVERLVATGLPVWLSFRRCRHGLCGVYGQHWGGPEGDAFGRTARRLEGLGVRALLVNCIPPDHVDGMVGYLRDFCDLPLGVYPNLGYQTVHGWRSDAGVDGGVFARMALRWREEGAQIIGGCCGVGPAHIAAARTLLAGTFPGRRRVQAREEAPAVDREAGEPSPWRDPRGRSLYPLEFPDLVVDDGVFAPTQGSFLVWKHLFATGAGAGGRCLDVGCGSGLQTVQLALNGAAHVHGIDLDPDAVNMTMNNAFRNGVADRVTVAAADLFAWVPEERYDVIVASLFQTPVDPAQAAGGHRPLDYWGRGGVDHLIRILPEALAPGGEAYIMLLSILSCRRTVAQFDADGLTSEVVDFAFFPFTEHFAASRDQIERVERLSDAHHLHIGPTDVMVAYLVRVTRAPAR